MLEFVHHIQYLVRNRDAMVDYMAKNFGMKPSHLETSKNGHEVRYRAGQTEIQFTEPTHPDSVMGQHLAKHGPGVFHVAWGVPNIQELTQQLHANGNKMQARGKDGKEFATRNVEGTLICNIDPAGSHGIWFQLAQD